MKVIIVNIATDEEIIVVDTDNLVKSKYYIIKPNIDLYNEDFKFYIDENEITFDEFKLWMNETVENELLPKISLDVFDDKVNEQVIFKRKDNSLFAIKYSKTF